MRILFWLVIVALIIIINETPVQAGPSFDLGKTVLTTRWEEADPNQASLSYNPAWEWPEVKLDLDGRYYLTGDEDEFSTLKIQVNLPENHNNPKFDLSYQWNEKYRLPSLGGSYWFEVLPNFKTGIKYATGYRKEAPGYMERYRYHYDQEDLQFDYDLKSWQLAMDLSRFAKYYPFSGYLSSEKLRLVESVGSKIGDNLQWLIQYEEEIGDYPEDESLTRSYWKEYWRLQLEFGKTTQWHWNCSYSQTDWDQGIEGHSYRDGRRLNWEFGSPHRQNNEYSFKVGIADLDYYSKTTYNDPEEPDTDEDDDIDGRLESKLAFGWIRHFDKFSLESELFYRVMRYKANSLGEQVVTGLTVTCQWEWDKYQLQLELAPDGNLQHYAGFYQLKLSYKP